MSPRCGSALTSPRSKDSALPCYLNWGFGVALVHYLELSPSSQNARFVIILFVESRFIPSDRTSKDFTRFLRFVFEFSLPTHHPSFGVSTQVQGRIKLKRVNVFAPVTGCLWSDGTMTASILSARLKTGIFPPITIISRSMTLFRSRCFGDGIKENNPVMFLKMPVAWIHATIMTLRRAVILALLLSSQCPPMSRLDRLNLRRSFCETLWLYLATICWVDNFDYVSRLVYNVGSLLNYLTLLVVLSFSTVRVDTVQESTIWQVLSLKVLPF